MKVSFEMSLSELESRRKLLDGHVSVHGGNSRGYVDSGSGDPRKRSLSGLYLAVGRSGTLRVGDRLRIR
jgi:hypothetical protein